MSKLQAQGLPWVCPGFTHGFGKAGRFTYLLEVFTAVSKPSRFTPARKG
jgi:hypothetical protein